MHTIATTATGLLRTTPAGVVLNDAAVDILVAAFEGAWKAGQAFEAAGALMSTAVVWLGTDGAGPAARTLLAFVLALHPALARLDAKRASALQTEAEAAAARFAAFSGTPGVTADTVLERVVDSGARPPGTTRASPLARFALLGQTPPKKPPPERT